MKSIALASIVVALSMNAAAAPETYILDQTHTLPTFAVSHLGMSTVRGMFEGATGRVVIDRSSRSGSIELKINTSTIYTGHSKSTGAGRTRDDHLKSADFFNVAEFPEMVFRSTRVIFGGDKPETIEGTLTLLGVTKPVTLKVDSFTCGVNPMSKKELCGADVSGVIKRSDFGMRYAPPPVVGDEVRLFIAVEGYKQ